LDGPSRPTQIYHRAGLTYRGGIAVGSSAASTLADERTLLVRLGPEAPSFRVLADVVQGLDRTVVVRAVESLDDLARADVASSRFLLALVATAGSVAMLISTLGLYGLLAHTVALRRREIGIRLALGAGPRAIGRAVLIRGLAVTAAGVGVGLLLAVPAAAGIRAELFGVHPFDPIAIAGACGVLIVAAGVASWRPTVRAMRVDPAELLRNE
jgi:predicted lysophospholipase L1 biosynthesis ABC-type transport system permease subunit